MTSLLTAPLSSDLLWEISYILLGAYLVFHPALVDPTSLGVVLGGGLLLLLLRRVPAETAGGLGRGWFLFLGYLLVSTFGSFSPGSTLQSTGLVFLATLLYCMAKSNSLASQERIETLGFFLAVLVSLMGLYQFFIGFGQLKPLLAPLAGGEQDALAAAIHNRRAMGPFATQGALAAFLILFLPLGFIRMKTALGIKKYLFGLAALLMVGGLLVAQSVGAWLSLTLAAITALLYRRSRAALVSLAVGGAGIIVLIALRGAQSWLAAAFGTRLTLWKDALGIFAVHPLWGTGLGTFDEAYQRAGLPLVTGARFPHNLFIQMLVETGVIGLALFLAALAGFLRRLKIPSRWEGWGAGVGILAFFLFSFVDLPFQMPELVWFFALLLGRLELKPEKPFLFPKLPAGCLEWALLGVLLVCGYWPPFQPLNFAILAIAFWTVLGLVGRQVPPLPLWAAAGAVFLLSRALSSPSSSGTVQFLEMAGLVSVFWLTISGFDKPERFFRRFCLLGLFWAAGAWWVSLSGAPFEAWTGGSNPKHLAVFLIPLFFLFFPTKFLGWGKGVVALAAFASILRLRATGALVGIAAGIPFIPKLTKNWKALLLAAMALGAALVHHFQPSSTQWDRLMIWKSALQAWSLSPLWGNGPGVFEREFEKVKEPRSGGLSRYLMEAGYTHNEYLEFLAAFGLVGLAFLITGVWFWFRRSPNENRPALVGVGVSSFFDFCLHTPRVVLQTTLLGPLGKPSKNPVSWVGGFLAFGLSMGLFGSAAFTPRLEKQAVLEESRNHFPQELRLLENAGRLNAWDARVLWPQAQLLEKLYLATADPVWKEKTDEVVARVMEFEKGDGKWLWEKAKLLSGRFLKDRSVESLGTAVSAWREAQTALPFSAYLQYDEAMFFLLSGQKDQAGLCLEKAVELEPNDARSWAKLGLLRKEMGKAAGARQAFSNSLRVYDVWKGKSVDEPEKAMLDIPENVLAQMRKEVR